MGRLNMKPKIHHKICSKHFEKSCFFAGMDRPCLRPDAVPTLFSCTQAKDTLRGTVAPQESLEKDSGMPCLDEASPASASLSRVLEESNGTVNRLLDSGSSQFTTTAAEALFLHTYCGDETTSPHLSKVARELQDVKQKLYAADRRLRRRDLTIRQQRTTIDVLQRQVSLLKHVSEEFRVSNCLPTDLIRDWHENASRVSRAHRFLGEWLPMPSMQLVRKHGVGTAVPGVFCMSSENLESFDEGWTKDWRTGGPADAGPAGRSLGPGSRRPGSDERPRGRPNDASPGRTDRRSHGGAWPAAWASAAWTTTSGPMDQPGCDDLGAS
ncbi:hypothetical protein HPB47_012649 [Ixodes persulcatus]|uniref:Uncharacterized protein n=1 Tax=Ixodes persulcatus TaxID=34615 RepID=A0AC60NSY9_IXOPE|nr:hypothetical protein HPB47_012649 [Ixodes persulcatus]